MFADCHAHYHELSAGQANELAGQARKEGIDFVITCGMDLETSAGSVRVAESSDLFYASVGIHPWRAVTIDDDLYRKLKSLAQRERVVAISECGLDFVGNLHHPELGVPDAKVKAVQRQALTQQLKLAREVNKPAIIHNRASDKALMDILRRQPGLKAVLHSFMGDSDMLAEAIGLGFYFSEGFLLLPPQGDLPAAIRFHKQVNQIRPDSNKFQEVVKRIPRDRLLLETDRYPQSMFGDRPLGRIREVAAQIAELWGTTAEEVGRITTSNSRRLLGMPPRPQ
ncbi:MAG: TatD family hydrolase [Chloroflexota bacterium]